MKVFITGGTAGIGSAIAIAYLGAGYTVGVCGRNKQNYYENFKEYEGNKNLFFYNVDVTNKEQVQTAIKDFTNKNSRLDILIANAGISNKKESIPSFEKSYEMININILGLMYSIETATEIFLKQKSGHIVLMSSIAAFFGTSGYATYCGTKAFILKFGEALAIDLNQKNIDVTIIAPGFVDTALTKINQFKMPFLMNSNDAAKRIVGAISSKKIFYVFPFRMRLLLFPFRFISTAF
ncbi:MAG: SDR family NAD(P)-dependent oxidoreductase, partial [Bacteriovoracaceae bacterium]